LKTAAFRQQMKAMHLRSHLPANHRLQAVDIKEDVMTASERLRVYHPDHTPKKSGGRRGLKCLSFKQQRYAVLDGRPLLSFKLLQKV